MKLKSVISMALLLLASSASFAQKTPANACSLITAKQINTLLGSKLTPNPGAGDASTCAFAAGEQSFSVSFFDYMKVAGNMLEMAADGDKNQAKPGGFHTFAAGGANAYYTTVADDFGKKVDCKFVLGTCMVRVDINGMDNDKVSAKLGELYNIIKGNFH